MDKTFKLLLVEDDRPFADELSRLLAASLPGVKLTCVGDGREAWEHLRRDDVDLVISGWNLPNLSGGDLLLNVRGHYKTRNLPFVLVTSRADRISVMYAARSGVTAYITKPFDRGHFAERIDQLLRLRARELEELANESLQASGMAQETRRQRGVEEVIRRIRTGEINLPVLPEMAAQVNAAISSPKTQIRDVTRVVGRDAALTSNLIAISNSSYYRGVRRFNTLEEAVVRLGFRQTLNYVLTFTTRGLFEVDDNFFGALLKQLWLHCLATAAAARAIAQHMHTLNQDLLFSKGLLHDIGKLLLIHTMTELPDSQLDDESVHTVLDTMHPEYGAALLRHWNFGNDFIEVSLCHHDVGGANAWTTEMLAVSFANILVRELGWSLKEGNGDDLTDHDMARQLGLRKSDIATILDETSEYVEETKLMIWGSVNE